MSEPTTSAHESDPALATAALTPEMVRLIAEKVYALWCQDLRLANERRPLSDQTTQRR